MDANNRRLPPVDEEAVNDELKHRGSIVAIMASFCALMLMMVFR